MILCLHYVMIWCSMMVSIYSRSACGKSGGEMREKTMMFRLHNFDAEIFNDARIEKEFPNYEVRTIFGGYVLIDNFNQPYAAAYFDEKTRCLHFFRLSSDFIDRDAICGFFEAFGSSMDKSVWDSYPVTPDAIIE